MPAHLRRPTARDGERYRNRRRNIWPHRRRCARPRPACRMNSGTRGGRGAAERLLDGLPEHEMRADEPHRLARRCAHRRQPETLGEAVQDRLRRLAGMNDAGGDAQRPGRRRDQKRGRFEVALEPAAGGELVFDQPVCGRRPARAAAPRRAPSARGPPWSRSNRRAGNPRCRRARRCLRESPPRDGGHAHRRGARPRRRGRLRRGKPRQLAHPPARTAPGTGPAQGPLCHCRLHAGCARPHVIMRKANDASVTSACALRRHVLYQVTAENRDAGAAQRQSRAGNRAWPWSTSRATGRPPSSDRRARLAGILAAIGRRRDRDPLHARPQDRRAGGAILPCHREGLLSRPKAST